MTKLVMITGASCTGKSSVILKLVQDYNFLRIPGFTTRKPRKGEMEGFDFWFISKDEFNDKFKNGELIDPNINLTEFNGNNYGSPNIWLKMSCNFLNIVFSPTSTKVARILKNEYGDRVFWVHLIVDENLRYTRLLERNISEKDLQYRLKNGDSIDVVNEADLNLNNGVLSIEVSVNLILSNLGM